MRVSTRRHYVLYCGMHECTADQGNVRYGMVLYARLLDVARLYMCGYMLLPQTIADEPMLSCMALP